MPKYTDEDIRNMSKITCKIAADYLGISPMAVSIGMRNDLLPIGFAIHNEERDRTYSESWSYHIIGERLIASVSIKVNIERVLMPFAKMPKTNRRTDILPNLVAVFRIILYYKSVTKYRRTRHTFTKSNGLYAMS